MVFNCLSACGSLDKEIVPTIEEQLLIPKKMEQTLSDKNPLENDIMGVILKSMWPMISEMGVVVP
jgi:hypothetical protein